MKSLTWLKYDFTAEMRSRVTTSTDDASTDQYPNPGPTVNFTIRSNASTTLRVLSPEKLELFAALIGITDKSGRKPFSRAGTEGGDYWIIYHLEPIYDTYGNLIYWLHMAKRQS